MNITVSANNNKEILEFPIIPRDTNLNNPSKNEEFQTINAGTLNLLGDKGLRSLSISSIFPKNKETWAKAGSVEGIKYVDFFNKWQGKNVPIRIVMSLESGKELVNMLCSIENFTYNFNSVENIKYTLDLKEYGV